LSFQGERPVSSADHLRVTVVSSGEAEHRVAHFRSREELFGFTRLEDSGLLLRIEPRARRPPIVVGVADLMQTLEEARPLLEGS
jgi:hypothetical protein